MRPAVIKILTSRSGGAFAKIMVVAVLAAVVLVGFGYAEVFLTRQKVDQVIANIPVNMDRADKSRIERYIIQQIVEDTDIDKATLDVSASKSKGLIEVQVRYEVPVNLQFTKYNAKVVQKGERVVGADSATTSDGREVKRRSGSFSEHTETYSIP